MDAETAVMLIQRNIVHVVADALLLLNTHAESRFIPYPDVAVEQPVKVRVGAVTVVDAPFQVNNNRNLPDGSQLGRVIVSYPAPVADTLNGRLPP